jgi:hypothetical protein
VRVHPIPTLALLALAGCPLPQALPEYPPGQTVTPPRVIVDDNVRQVAFPQPLVEVPAGCPIAPTYALSVFLKDLNTEETVTGRWFVNYDARQQFSPTVVVQQQDQIPPPSIDALDQTLRGSGVLTFAPYTRTPAAGTGGGSGATTGAVHVVEYVVSNRFDPAYGNDAVDRPNRKPYQDADVQFEVQSFRWVFVTVPPSAATPCP